MTNLVMVGQPVMERPKMLGWVTNYLTMEHPLLSMNILSTVLAKKLLAAFLLLLSMLIKSLIFQSILTMNILSFIGKFFILFKLFKVVAHSRCITVDTEHSIPFCILLHLNHSLFSQVEVIPGILRREAVVDPLLI